MEDFSRRSERADFGQTAPGRLFADREFAGDTYEKMKRAEDLRKKIAKKDESIAHIQANIEEFASRITKGSSIKGAERLRASLENETKLAKIGLEREKGRLVTEKGTLERELESLNN